MYLTSVDPLPTHLGVGLLKRDQPLLHRPPFDDVQQGRRILPDLREENNGKKKKKRLNERAYLRSHDNNCSYKYTPINVSVHVLHVLCRFAWISNNTERTD